MLQPSWKKYFSTFFIGLIYIFTDRKKDLVKLQLGEYVSLGKVEAELKTCPVVENICVYGDSHKSYTVALVVPNQYYLEQIANDLGITGKNLEELCDNPDIEKAVLQELVEQAKKCIYLKNNRLSKYQFSNLFNDV